MNHVTTTLVLILTLAAQPSAHATPNPACVVSVMTPAFCAAQIAIPVIGILTASACLVVTTATGLGCALSDD